MVFCYTLRHILNVYRLGIGRIGYCELNMCCHLDKFILGFLYDFAFYQFNSVSIVIPMWTITVRTPSSKSLWFDEALHGCVYVWVKRIIGQAPRRTSSFPHFSRMRWILPSKAIWIIFVCRSEDMKIVICANNHVPCKILVKSSVMHAYQLSHTKWNDLFALFLE